MPTVEDEFTAELVEVRQSFINSLDPRVVRLSELLIALASATPEARAEIQAIAHKLAGSCASFGLEFIGDAAMALEDKLIKAKAESNIFIAGEVEGLIELCILAMCSVQYL